jgi:hypothetical protein
MAPYCNATNVPVAVRQSVFRKDVDFSRVQGSGAPPNTRKFKTLRRPCPTISPDRSAGKTISRG